MGLPQFVPFEFVIVKTITPSAGKIADVGYVEFYYRK
jgi:hypothetical protein